MDLLRPEHCRCGNTFEAAMSIEDQLPETLMHYGWVERGIFQRWGKETSVTREQFKTRWRGWLIDMSPESWVFNGSDGSWWTVTFKPITLHRYPDLNTAVAITLLKLG